MVQTIKKAIIELMLRKVIYLQYGIIVVILVAFISHFADKMQFNRWFDNRSEKVVTKYYGELSPENINVKSKLQNWRKGFNDNRGFVIDTCRSVKAGVASYDFNVKPYCDYVGIKIP